jgi:hypothetical protein
MSKSRLRYLSSAFLGFAAGLVALSAAPHAQVAPYLLGYLTCTLAGQDDPATPGQGRDALCHFRPGRSGPEETYIGTLQGLGTPQSLFGKGTIILAVKGSSTADVIPGMLEQNYSADATKTSAASIPLIGDTNKELSPQPMTEEEGRVAKGGDKTPDAAIVLIELRLHVSPA